MRAQQLFWSLVLVLVACREVVGAPPEIGNRLYEGDRLYEGNIARYLQALHLPPPDTDSLSLLPRLTPRYSIGNEWNYQREPSFYLLPELEEQRELRKRAKPSLSIVNSLDVLRRRVLLDMIRRQETEKNKQAEVNRQILQTVGKRDN